MPYTQKFENPNKLGYNAKTGMWTPYDSTTLGYGLLTKYIGKTKVSDADVKNY